MTNLSLSKTDGLEINMISIMTFLILTCDQSSCTFSCKKQNVHMFLQNNIQRRRKNIKNIKCF